MNIERQMEFNALANERVASANIREPIADCETIDDVAKVIGNHLHFVTHRLPIEDWRNEYEVFAPIYGAQCRKDWRASQRKEEKMERNNTIKMSIGVLMVMLVLMVAIVFVGYGAITMSPLMIAGGLVSLVLVPMILRDIE